MRKIYEEFFHVPKHGKIRENVILSRITLAVFIIVACLAAMSISAYAYFSHNVTSGSNVIKAANFVADISLFPKGSTTEITPESNLDGVSFYRLAAGEYEVTVSKGQENTASTGFCIVLADGKEYHTQQIGVDVAAPNGTRDSVRFVLKVQSTSVVEIRSHWGTSSHYRDAAAAPNELYIEESDSPRTIPVGNALTMSPKPVMPDDSVSTENGDNSTETATDPDVTTTDSDTGTDVSATDSTETLSGDAEGGTSSNTGTPEDTSSATPGEDVTTDE